MFLAKAQKEWRRYTGFSLSPLSPLSHASACRHFCGRGSDGCGWSSHETGCVQEGASTLAGVDPSSPLMNHQVQESWPNLIALWPLSLSFYHFMEVGSFWLEDLQGESENAGEVMEREELWKTTL